MKRFLHAALILMMTVVVAVPTTAYALTLDQAQSQGLVGEQPNGYLGVVQNAPGVAALVDRINLQRKDLYRDVARRNNLPLTSVEALAGEKAINNARPGTFIQSGGRWVRK